MASSGPNYGTAADNGGGAFAWADPSNASAPDGSVATCSTSNDQVTNYLRWTSLGFAVPAGATVDGVVLEILASGTATTLSDSDVYLLKAGSQSGVNKAAHSPLPASATLFSYGGASDLWGATLTPSDVNDAGFGAEARYTTPSLGSRTVSVDYGRLTVYYTPSGGGGQPSSAAITLCM